MNETFSTEIYFHKVSVCSAGKSVKLVHIFSSQASGNEELCDIQAEGQGRVGSEHLDITIAEETCL
jgi:hypothetical protein